MATHKIMIAGFGGQGVMLMGQILAYAGLFEGKDVTWMPSYGPEMRGGTANCTVIVSDSKISSPVITEATSLVAMNLPSMLRFEDMISPGGDLFINASLINEEPKRKDIRIHKVDAAKYADQLKNNKVANMVLLGAIARTTGVVSMESLEKAMGKIFTGNKAKLIPLNVQALNAWVPQM